METNNIFYKKIMETIKRTNLILEMSYEGNVGLQEMMQFFRIATAEDIKQFESLMANQDLANAWELVQRVTGVRLKGL